MNELFFNTMPKAALIIGLFMTVVFLVAQQIKNNSIVDIAWGLGFTLVTNKLLFDFNVWHFTPQLIIAFMISLWGVRLSLYILNRNKGKTEDFRYQNFRKKWGKYQKTGAFLQVFMLQGFIMWWVLMPVYAVFSGAPHWIFGWQMAIQIIGIILFTIGFLFEAIGDAQLKNFKSKKENKGRIMTSGLWKFTRHPNYFGECVLWWGIALFALPFPHGWLGFIAPVIMTYLLTKVSGVPMLEEKYVNNPEFAEYSKNTPSFFPKLW